MNDYKKINSTHHLSSYEVKVPYWNGELKKLSPFSEWVNNKSPEWYKAYNSIKNDRQSEFKKAFLRNLLDAFCGLLVLLSAQFGTYDFSPANNSLTVDCPDMGMEFGIGGYFHIKFPDDFQEEDCYDFDWEQLRDNLDPFQIIHYQ